MIKGKTYRYDDEFKAKARAHQFAFRENELNDFYDEKNPQVILSPNAAKQGLIFCDTYRELIKNGQPKNVHHILKLNRYMVLRKKSKMRTTSSNYKNAIQY